jgi:HEPN domain-containing protein/predicted nucleotidyltransferase
MAVVTQEIEVAVQRLQAVFDAEEIVLFGSWAYGTPRPDSDIDLLVVLHPTDEPPAGRQRRAMQALGANGRRRVDGHVWAYTPEELLEQLRRGSTAVRDALAKGTRLFPADGHSRYVDLAGEWSATGAEETLLQKAREDLDTAEVLSQVVGNRMGQWWTVAFHAQQAAEKALKALIYHLGGEPERTHSLSDLAEKAAGLDAARGRPLFLKYQPRLAELGKHAVQPRYTDAPPISEAEARAAVAIARDALADITVIVGTRR